MTPNDAVIRVPASSANLGAGFDVLGMALTLYAHVGLGEAPARARTVDVHHPAAVACAEMAQRLDVASPGPLGDRLPGSLWVHSSIPAARGLGFSGTMRVGGAAAAVAGLVGRDAVADPGYRREIFACARALEGHGDNAAASVYGGVTVSTDDRATAVPLGLGGDDLAAVVLAWVPSTSETHTQQSRAALAPQVTRDDAVFNLGRVALFVAAWATGDRAALRSATQDRLHQPARLAAQPESARALNVALEHGADAAWLSGSGPTVAVLCDASSADRIADALPKSGHVKQLGIDTAGTCVVGHGELPAA